MLIQKVNTAVILQKVFGPNAAAQLAQIDPKIKPSWSSGVFKLANVNRSVNIPMNLTVTQSIVDDSVAIPANVQKELFDLAVKHLTGTGEPTHITKDIKTSLAEAVMKAAPKQATVATSADEVGGAVTGTLPPMDQAKAMKMMLKDPIKLPMATEQYSAVFGASAASRYFALGCVEITKGKYVKLAARYKGTEVSIRIEGDVPGPMSMDLGKLAITKKSPHYSGHFVVKDDLMAARVVAGVLANMNGTHLWPMPNVKLIKNKGA